MRWQLNNCFLFYLKVTFSTIPYHDVINRRKRQDEVNEMFESPEVIEKVLKFDRSSLRD